MKSILLTTTVASLLMANISLAEKKESGGTRGGGNAHICFDDSSIPSEIRRVNSAGVPVDPAIQNEHIPHITSIEMLDLYEYRQTKGFGPGIVPPTVKPLPGESYTNFVKRLLPKLKEFYPDLHEKAEMALDTIPESKAVGHENGIDPVNDYNLFGRINTKYCVVGTVLLHSKSKGIELHYDSRLWNHPLFSAEQKYVAYLHEIIYLADRARSGWRVEDSQMARKFVGWLLRESITQQENFEFWSPYLKDHFVIYGYSQLKDTDKFFIKHNMSSDSIKEFNRIDQSLNISKSEIEWSFHSDLVVLANGVYRIVEKARLGNSDKEYNRDFLSLTSYNYLHTDSSSGSNLLVGYEKVAANLQSQLKVYKNAANLERKFMESSERKAFRATAQEILKNYKTEIENLIALLEKKKMPKSLEEKSRESLRLLVETAIRHQKKHLEQSIKGILENRYLLDDQKSILVEAMKKAAGRSVSDAGKIADQLFDLRYSDIMKELSDEEKKLMYNQAEELFSGWNNQLLQPIKVDIK